MKTPTASTDGVSKGNKGYSFYRSKNNHFYQLHQQFVKELHLEITPILTLIEIALEELFYIKNTTLPQASQYYHFHKEKGDYSDSMIDALLMRCENLEMAVNTIFALIARIQQHLPILEKLERLEAKAIDTWGELPNRYAVVIYYDILNPDPKEKINLALDRP